MIQPQNSAAAAPESELANLIAYIGSLAAGSFWGNITIKMQAGRVIHVVREESLKPNQLVQGHRNNNESRNRK